MPLNPQQRSLAILGGVFGGGLLITFLLVSLVSGGDDERKVSISPKQPTTSSSTTTTVPPTIATVPSTVPQTVATVPITNPPPNTIPPGTVQIVTTTKPPAPATTKPKPPTTTTTKPKTKAQILDEQLEEALFGGPPPDGTPSRVRVVIDEDDGEVRIRWELDDSLSEEEQKYQARYDAAKLLEVIQGFSGLEDEDIILRARAADPTILNPDHRKFVVRLLYTRATLDGIDFGTLDPLTVFDVPPADDANIDDSLNPTPTPTSSTSSTTTTT
jgi:hypothetical protein